MLDVGSRLVIVVAEAGVADSPGATLPDLLCGDGINAALPSVSHPILPFLHTPYSRRRLSVPSFLPPTANQRSFQNTPLHTHLAPIPTRQYRNYY